jgi:hypothetical protein
VAKEYCAFVENIAGTDKENLIDKSVKILSLLYLKATMLPGTEIVNDELNEKFVTEFDWQFVRNGIETIMEDDDQYLDYFDNDMNETVEPVSSTISENMADIYQDLKDFLEIYKLGNEELSNDAIHDCHLNFRDYWGFRLVNTLKIFHYLTHKECHKEKLSKAKGKISRNTENWFLSKAQHDSKKNE